MDESSPNKSFTVLHFLVQNIHACIELTAIKRVLPLSAVEAVPGSPAYVVGLMNLAGQSIPIIDLSLRMGMPRHKPYSLNNPILLCHHQHQQAGIVVDEILDLADIDESELQMRHDFAKKESPFIAIAPLNNTLSLLLNIKRIISISLTAEKIDLQINKHLLNEVIKHHE